MTDLIKNDDAYQKGWLNGFKVFLIYCHILKHYGILPMKIQLASGAAAKLNIIIFIPFQQIAQQVETLLMQRHYRNMAVQYQLFCMASVDQFFQQSMPLGQYNEQINMIFFSKINYPLINIVIGNEMIFMFYLFQQFI